MFSAPLEKKKREREKPVLAFYTTLFQPEHLNIKLNTGELFPY